MRQPYCHRAISRPGAGGEGGGRGAGNGINGDERGWDGWGMKRG